MKNIVYKLLVIAFTASAVSGCYYDVEEELYPAQAIDSTGCDTSNVTYARVLPIMQNNCYSCHAGSAPSGNVNLEGHANLKVYADNGMLMGTVNHSSGFSPMPQGGNKLSACNIALIQKWINNGTPNN